MPRSYCAQNECGRRCKSSFGPRQRGHVFKRAASFVVEALEKRTFLTVSPTWLVSFTGTGSSNNPRPGANPAAGLIMDGAGDLFGTAANGGLHGDGVAFEIANDVNHTLYAYSFN